MSCQNIKQGTCDYFSCLSDDLLRHILSFLTMKLVIKTSILSKRWRYLWTTVPCLVFSDSWNLVGVDPVTFIDKSIARHVGTTLRKFHIMFEYKDTDGPQIDSWIQFAVKCNVEEMVLVLDGCSSDDFWENDPKYELPHYLFQCETIKDLSISGTQFNLPTSVHLRSLRKLSLYNLDIPSDAIEHLTSSCPHLEHLSLFGCNMSDDLNIYDPNGRLQILRIHELQSTYSDTTNVVIHAPNLHFLQFEWCLPRGSYLVKKLSSFTNVSFLFGSRENYNDRLYDATDGYHMALILHGLHVKNLELSCFCVQVLSLWEFERKEHFCIDATSIQLETRFSKWELPGIAYVLMNSSNLETLKINFRGVKRFWELLQIKIDDAITQQYDFEETGYWKSHELVFSTLPCKIKRVTIYGFPHHSSNVNKYNAIWMVRFLLKNLKMLEKITIFIANKRGSEVLDGDHSELRDLFTCGFSAACPNAELLIF